MLELCFSQSARGGLRCAQHCGGGGRKVIGVIVGRDDGRPATRKEIRQAQKQAQQKREALDREAIPLGDMVLSLERCAAQAAEYGHSVSREVGYLTIHSMLHLLGYDHLDEGPEKARMRAREEMILRRVNLNR